MTLWPIISHALLFGVILSAVLFTLMLVVARVNPEIMLKAYPPDGYSDYGFHFRGFLIGIVISLLISLLLPVIVTALF